MQLLAALIVTEPSEQSASPPHPVNTELEEGAAVSATDAPAANEKEQAVPQEIPAGTLEMVPDPEPVFVTVSTGPPPPQELPPSP